MALQVSASRAPSVFADATVTTGSVLTVPRQQQKLFKNASAYIEVDGKREMLFSDTEGVRRNANTRTDISRRLKDRVVAKQKVEAEQQAQQLHQEQVQQQSNHTQEKKKKTRKRRAKAKQVQGFEPTAVNEEVQEGNGSRTTLPL